MSKKDFSQDTSDVFSQMFSAETINKVDSKEKKETVKVSKKKNESENVEKNIISTNKKDEKEKKIFDKKYRYSFYAEPVLNDYLENVVWIKRIKNIPPFLNNLIKQDLLELLKIPQDSTNEEIEKAWNKYKTDNNL